MHLLQNTLKAKFILKHLEHTQSLGLGQNLFFLIGSLFGAFLSIWAFLLLFLLSLLKILFLLYVLLLSVLTFKDNGYLF